jgi:hypothetical protein
VAPLASTKDESMATIKISDSASAEVLTANPQASSGFAKYLKGPAAPLLAGKDLAGQFKRDLPLVSPGEGGFKLQWAGDVPLGTDAVSVKAAAGASALISVYNHTGMLLVDDAFVGPPIKVPAGQAFVSFAFRPTLKIGATAQHAALAFGFEAASEAEWRFYHPVSVAGEKVSTFGDACKELFETLTIPNSVDDLKAIAGREPGTMSIVSGRGLLSIGCSANVAAAINPLASIDTLGKLGTVNVSGTLAAKVGVKATISGEYQIRVQTVAPGRVRLGYHKMAAREVGVTLDASAGPGLTLGDKDLLKMLFGDSTTPGRTIEESLVAAGVTSAQLKKITTALKAGLTRRLQLEIGASFSALKQDEAAFLYELDLAALNATAVAAVEKALSGDLSELTLLEDDLATHGVTILQSRTAELRKRVVKWRLNLVGLVNVLSVSELAVKATVVHDEESGEVVMTDAATSHKVKAITSRKELQKLLYESLMLTVTYKASGLDANTSLNAAQSYFKIDRDVNRQEMADFLDAIAAVGLMRADDIEDRMGLIDDFDRGSLLIDVEYDQAACERMFLDETGAPRTRDFYEDVGKLALLALIQPDDVDAYRREPMKNAALWQRMRDSVSSDFSTILPPPITGGSDEARKLHVAIVTADYSMIVWWAGAMASAAQKLADMRAFLAGPPPVTPSDTNKAFTKRRADLSEAMVETIQKSPSTFGGDPWGLVALYYASKRSATVNAAVVSPRLTMFLP